MARGALARAYRVMDEPVPGRLSRYTVSPMWILLALMLGGGLLGWPWFVLNAFALGDPAKRRELLLVLASFGAAVVLVVSMIYGAHAGLLGKRSLHYLAILLPAMKMGFGFAIFRMQERTFALYQYFGGQVRNGAPIALLSFFAGGRLLDALGSTFWKLVLS